SRLACARVLSLDRAGSSAAFPIVLLGVDSHPFSAKMISMRNTLVSLAALSAALLAAASLPIQAQTIGTSVASGTARVIVKLRADSPLLPKALSGAAQKPTHAEALGQRLGIAMNDGAAVSARTQIIFADGITSTELAQ